MHVNMSKIGNSLEVQWLGRSFHGRGTKILQVIQFSQKEKKSRITTERIGRIRTKIRLGEKRKLTQTQNKGRRKKAAWKN